MNVLKPESRLLSNMASSQTRSPLSSSTSRAPISMLLSPCAMLSQGLLLVSKSLLLLLLLQLLLLLLLQRPLLLLKPERTKLHLSTTAMPKTLQSSHEKRTPLSPPLPSLLPLLLTTNKTPLLLITRRVKVKARRPRRKQRPRRPKNWRPVRNQRPKARPREMPIKVMERRLMITRVEKQQSKRRKLLRIKAGLWLRLAVLKPRRTR